MYWCNQNKVMSSKTHVETINSVSQFLAVLPLSLFEKMLSLLILGFLPFKYIAFYHLTNAILYLIFKISTL